MSGRAGSGRGAPSRGGASPRAGVQVVKLGGSLLETPALRDAALAAIARCRRDGAALVLVHGGGKKVDATLRALGIAKRTHAGLRVTDAATLEVVTGVLAGVVNKGLVADLAARGVAAAGVAGVDGGTILAEPHAPVDGVDLGHVGRVLRAEPALVRSILDGDLMPVVAPVGMARDGRLLNVNADAAAAALAAALGAGRLVFLTDVEGLKDAGGRVVPRLDRDAAVRLLGTGAIRDGMRPKIAACLDALAGGVTEILIAGPERHAAALQRGLGGTLLVAA